MVLETHIATYYPFYTAKLYNFEESIVTGPGKTGLICTSTGFHFLSVQESYTRALPETPRT